MRVAPGGQLDQGEVFSDEPHDLRPILVGDSESAQDVVRNRRADLGMVRGTSHLADVVQERRKEQKVGALDAADQAAGDHDRLDGVPVDSVPVHGVVLGATADVPPLRDPGLDDADEVQAFPDTDQPRACREEVGE